jgi:hypothetical protein
MPSGPKGKMVMKFDFEDMSDSEQENDRNSSQELPVSSLMAANKVQNLKREDAHQPSKLFGKPGLKLQINLSNEDNDNWPVNKKPSLGVEIPDDNQLQISDKHKSNTRQIEKHDALSQPKSQFENENVEAKSNLRDKGKTFNFGLAADFSGSEDEEEDAGQINFYKNEPKEPSQEEEKNNSDEEMQIHLMNSRKSERVNPFTQRLGKQELQPSQIRRNKQAALKLQQSLQSKKPQLRLGEEGGEQLSIEIPEGSKGRARAEPQSNNFMPETTPLEAPHQHQNEAADNLNLRSSSAQIGSSNLQTAMETDHNTPSQGLLSSKQDQQVISEGNQIDSGGHAQPILASQQANKSFKSRVSQNLPGTNRNTNSYTATAPGKPKSNFRGIGLDIEAINELYDYGGEQGTKKQNVQDELMDFETGILELANQCLAAMRREKPTDPIIDDNDQVKKSFEEKFQINSQGNQSDCSSEGNEKSKANDSSNEQPNYFRPNFNVPTTMRGIKNLALSIGGFKNEGTHKTTSNQHEYLSKDQIEESQFEDYEDEDMPNNAPHEQAELSNRNLNLIEADINASTNRMAHQSQSSGQEQQSVLPQKKMKLQIIDYDIIKDEDESNHNIEDNQALKTDKSHESQKSYNEMANSKFDAIPESFDETPHYDKTEKHLREGDRHLDGLRDQKEDESEDLYESTSDVQDQDFLE